MFEDVGWQHFEIGDMFIEDRYPEVYRLVRKEADGTFIGCQVGTLKRTGLAYQLELGEEVNFFGMGGAYGPCLIKVSSGNKKDREEEAE